MQTGGDTPEPAELFGETFETVDLFGQTVPVETPLEKDFRLYHERNPHIFELFASITLMAKRRNKKVGAWLVANQIRYSKTVVEDDPDEKYKIPNDYISLFARLVMREYPEELDKYFTIKHLKNARGVQNIPPVRNKGVV